MRTSWLPIVVIFLTGTQAVPTARGSQTHNQTDYLALPVSCPFTILEIDGTKNAQPNQATYDFGHVVLELQKQPIRHDFTLRNASNATVAIDRIEPECPCTSVLVQAPTSHGICTVPSGGQVTITVSVDARDLAPAPFDKLVSVFLAGRQQPALTFHITGTIDAAATYEPGNASFDTVTLGLSPTVSFTQELDTKVYGGKPRDPVSSDQGFEVIRVPHSELADKPGKIVRKYLVRVVPNSRRLGTRHAIIAMPGKNGGLEPTRFSVDAFVVGDIVPDQADLSFDLVKLNGRATQYVTLTSTKPSAMSGLKITCGKKELKAEVSSHGSRKLGPGTTTLRAVLTPSKIGIFESKIEITTRSGQVLDLPVWASVKNEIAATSTASKPAPSVLQERASD